LYRIFISSTESPHIHSVLPGYQLVNETDSFDIFCDATGNPPPIITWTKIGDNSKVYSTGKSLRVQKAEKSDFGTYRCTAVSVRGENVSASATVEIDNCKLTFHVLRCLCKTRQNILDTCTVLISFYLHTVRESIFYYTISAPVPLNSPMCLFPCHDSVSLMQSVLIKPSSK